MYQKIETAEDALKAARESEKEGLTGLYPKALQILAEQFKKLEGDLAGYVLTHKSDSSHITNLELDAARYRWLRDRDLDTISAGGVFAGQTPENFILNGVDLDSAIDQAMRK